ncbi:hypothetical protein I3J09_02140 [Streptomyces clavuligerus]|uniref:hypothetical protein n=1 Tax=Streptomyces clavuligerus TaxID=1901 RepID=UPI000810917A|nr:hypothetical protein [Streptomyces clavuligerus]ANW17104.1 hypothetical protein BB341_02150 [Streptomyces clavuligerus]AXU11642.1 hypothetical protein D1794_02255 [Streptomyces clavuligerus]MBY6301479.1 hypothetical protein [Streptomyces clavuligerus]QPL61763.1 hypothetical protein I3J04_02125 [Streptomyces clavuligerus]QPL67796.1 hypothetical protein I3J05_02140 [Streptomyces clavuligerus]
MTRSAPTATGPAACVTAAAAPTTDATQAAGLRSGLAVYTSLQASAQFADAKAGILGAVQAGLMATALPQGGAVRDAWERGGPLAWCAVGLLLLQVAAFLPAVTCVIQALRPRLGPPPAPNRFSLPLLAAADGSVPPADEDSECREIWQLIPILAQVAVVKNRHIGRGVGWTGLMAMAAGLSFAARPLLP